MNNKAKVAHSDWLCQRSRMIEASERDTQARAMRLEATRTTTEPPWMLQSRAFQKM